MERKKSSMDPRIRSLCGKKMQLQLAEKKLRKMQSYRHQKWFKTNEERKLKEDIERKLNEIRQIETEFVETLGQLKQFSIVVADTGDFHIERKLNEIRQIETEFVETLGQLKQ